MALRKSQLPDPIEFTFKGDRLLSSNVRVSGTSETWLHAGGKQTQTTVGHLSGNGNCQVRELTTPQTGTLDWVVENSRFVGTI